MRIKIFKTLIFFGFYIIIPTSCSSNNFIIDNWEEVRPTKIAYLGIIPYMESMYNPETGESSDLTYFLFGSTDINLIDEKYNFWCPAYLNDSICTKLQKRYPEYEIRNFGETKNKISELQLSDCVDTLINITAIKQLEKSEIKKYSSVINKICSLLNVDALFIGNSGTPSFTQDKVWLDNKYYLINKNGEILFYFENRLKTFIYQGSKIKFFWQIEKHNIENSARILAQESIDYLVESFPAKYNPEIKNKKQSPILPIVLSSEGKLFIRSLYQLKVEIKNSDGETVYKPEDLQSEYIWDYNTELKEKKDQIYFIRFDNSQKDYEIILN
ncbi:MAG: hypothetical protein WAU11_07245 [Ignavibacteriaceae bacterium]